MHSREPVDGSEPALASTPVLANQGSPSRQSGSPSATAGIGLTETEAERRLREVGPNAIPEKRPRAWLTFLGKFWAPVPWMLQAAIVLELVLGHTLQALLFTTLLVFNAGLSYAQEQRAQSALALLRQKLSVQARVRRDGRWQVRPAPDLVPGDAVHLRVAGPVQQREPEVASRRTRRHPRGSRAAASFWPGPWGASPVPGANVPSTACNRARACRR